MKTKLKNQKGFTIIEVLIVLAIAGLILLIVFLAVPALQRNSRNTQSRNAAAAVLGGVNDFSTANNGTFPTTVAVANGIVTFTGAAGTTPSEAKVKAGTTVALANGVPAATGAINVAINYGCNGNAPVAKPRAVAALFKIEATSSTLGDQCTES